MKTCAVVIAVWFKPPVLQLVKRMIKRFERINHMPVHLIHGLNLKGEFLSGPAYAKYHAWQKVSSDIERIVYLDCDMIPLRPLPELPAADFAAAPDLQTRTDCVTEHWPLIRRAGTYFNAGFFVATRKTEKIFERMLLRQCHGIGPAMPWHVDQTMLNVEVQAAVEAGEIEFEKLSKQWNNLALIDPEPVEAPYMLHMSGGDKWKLRFASCAIDHLEQMNEARRLLSIVKK